LNETVTEVTPMLLGGSPPSNGGSGVSIGSGNEIGVIGLRFTCLTNGTSEIAVLILTELGTSRFDLAKSCDRKIIPQGWPLQGFMAGTSEHLVLDGKPDIIVNGMVTPSFSEVNPETTVTSEGAKPRKGSTSVWDTKAPSAGHHVYGEEEDSATFYLTMRNSIYPLFLSTPFVEEEPPDGLRRIAFPTITGFPSQSDLKLSADSIVPVKVTFHCVLDGETSITVVLVLKTDVNTHKTFGIRWRFRKLCKRNPTSTNASEPVIRGLHIGLHDYDDVMMDGTVEPIFSRDDVANSTGDLKINLVTVPRNVENVRFVMSYSPDEDDHKGPVPLSVERMVAVAENANIVSPYVFSRMARPLLGKHPFTKPLDKWPFTLNFHCTGTGRSIISVMAHVWVGTPYNDTGKGGGTLGERGRSEEGHSEGGITEAGTMSEDSDLVMKTVRFDIGKHCINPEDAPVDERGGIGIPGFTIQMERDLDAIGHPMPFAMSSNDHVATPRTLPAKGSEPNGQNDQASGEKNIKNSTEDGDDSSSTLMTIVRNGYPLDIFFGKTRNQKFRKSDIWRKIIIDAQTESTTLLFSFKPGVESGETMEECMQRECQGLLEECSGEDSECPCESRCQEWLKVGGGGGRGEQESTLRLTVDPPTIFRHDASTNPVLSGPISEGVTLDAENSAAELVIDWNCRSSGETLVTIRVPVVGQGILAFTLPKYCGGDTVRFTRTRMIGFMVSSVEPPAEPEPDEDFDDDDDDADEEDNHEDTGSHHRRHYPRRSNPLGIRVGDIVINGETALNYVPLKWNTPAAKKPNNMIRMLDPKHAQPRERRIVMNKERQTSFYVWRDFPKNEEFRHLDWASRLPIVGVYAISHRAICNPTVEHNITLAGEGNGVKKAESSKKKKLKIGTPEPDLDNYLGPVHTLNVTYNCVWDGSTTVTVILLMRGGNKVSFSFTKICARDEDSLAPIENCAIWESESEETDLSNESTEPITDDSDTDPDGTNILHKCAQCDQGYKRIRVSEARNVSDKCELDEDAEEDREDDEDYEDMFSWDYDNDEDTAANPDDEIAASKDGYFSHHQGPTEEFQQPHDLTVNIATNEECAQNQKNCDVVQVGTIMPGFSILSSKYHTAEEMAVHAGTHVSLTDEDETKFFIAKPSSIDASSVSFRHPSVQVKPMNHQTGICNPVLLGSGARGGEVTLVKPAELRIRYNCQKPGVVALLVSLPLERPYGRTVSFSYVKICGGFKANTESVVTASGVMYLALTLCLGVLMLVVYVGYKSVNVIVHRYRRVKDTFPRPPESATSVEMTSTK